MRARNFLIEGAIIVLISICIFAEYQKDDWYQKKEKGDRIENTVYYKISDLKMPEWIKRINSLFVKLADANYHPQEVPMDLPTAIMMGSAIFIWARRELW